MRLTIQRRVFISTFLLSGTMALLLIGLMRWNLERGFSRYVVIAELEHVSWIAKNIEDAYARQGNWDFLLGDENAWNRLHVPGGSFPALPSRGNKELLSPPAGLHVMESDPPPRFPERHLRPGLGYGPPPGSFEPGSPDFTPLDKPPQQGANNERKPDILNIGPRLSVRDISGKLLAGNPQSDSLAASLPILYQGQRVGELTLLPPHTGDELKAAFLATQTRQLWLSGLVALLLSLVASWMLARQFLSPIKELATGVRHIARGLFSERIRLQRSDELGELAADFNAMAEMLARTEESRRQWVSDSSHELRTPIAVLRAEIEALQDGVRVADEKTLARLHKQVMQMSKLVDDLRLTLDREGGLSCLELSTIAPLKVLEECIEEFSPRFAATRIALVATGLPQKDPGWHIRGDADRLHQVFVNLLENSLRYTHQDGRLEVTATVAERKLRLSFNDTAPAPPDATLPRLFERFFRAEPSRSRELGGSGLGLAICKTIIEAHSGTIRASKSTLGGLCISIDLPLSK
jgi:two-component system sensor histidine kinase BaeS